MKQQKILIGALLATAVIGVSSCSSDIIPTTPITPTQSQEPEVIKKTISFDSQGGSSVISVSVKVGDKVTKPNNPEKTGYVFSGWYKEASCVNEWNFETETVLGDTTLYAKWTVVDNPTPNPDPTPLKSFTIKFVTNCSDIVADEAISENNKVSMPSNIQKEGYTLAGWYLDEAYQNEYDFNTPVTSNLTLYAKWVVSEYKVTFNGTTLPDVEVKHGEHIEKPSNPTKTGYTFVGWYSDNACTTVFDFENSFLVAEFKFY